VYIQHIHSTSKVLYLNALD